MVYILYKQIAKRGHYYVSQLTQSSIEMPSAIAPIGLKGLTQLSIRFELR